MGLVVIVMLQVAFNLYLMKSVGDIQKDLQMLQESVDVDVKRYRRDEPVVSFVQLSHILLLKPMQFFIATFFAIIKFIIYLNH